MIFQRIWNSFISYGFFIKSKYFVTIYKERERERERENARRNLLHFTPSKYLAKSRFTNVSRIANVLANARDRYFLQPFYFSTPYQATSPPHRYEHSEFRITTRMARKKMATPSNHHLSLSLSLSLSLVTITLSFSPRNLFFTWMGWPWTANTWRLLAGNGERTAWQ